jgi:hypothetical protein
VLRVREYGHADERSERRNFFLPNLPGFVRKVRQEKVR